MPRHLIVPFTIALTACVSAPPTDAGGDTGPAADPTAVVFAPDHLLAVAIELAPADWDTLRAQTRSVFDILGGSCLDGPRDQPFTVFSGTVTIDGETFTDVGVRKKGFLGSLSFDKPALKVKLDEVVAGRSFHGVDRLTLNNALQDPAYVRQCLGYGLFTAAGLPAPRCNLAQVTVNGEGLGIYVNVESVKKDFLARHFADNDGNLYEGTLSDFRPEWIATFERKTNEADLDRSDLALVVTALEASDADLVTALDPFVDLGEFFDFWAMEAIIGHWDGYAGNTNNFFVYRDPTTSRFSFIPWGIDGVMSFDPAAPDGGVILATGVLPWRFLQIDETRALFESRLRTLLAEAWDDEALVAEIDRMEGSIAPVADPDGDLGLAAQVQGVRDFALQRRGQILAQLDIGLPTGVQPLRPPPCFDTLGELAGDFATTWGSLGAENPFAGTSGSVTGQLAEIGVEATVTLAGATAGFDSNPDGAGLPILQVLALLSDDTVLVLMFQLGDPTALAPGGVATVDWIATVGVLVLFTPSTGQSEILGFFGEGTVSFTDATTTDGAPVAGTYSVTVSRAGL